MVVFRVMFRVVFTVWRYLKLSGAVYSYLVLSGDIGRYLAQSGAIWRYWNYQALPGVPGTLQRSLTLAGAVSLALKLDLDCRCLQNAQVDIT